MSEAEKLKKKIRAAFKKYMTADSRELSTVVGRIDGPGKLYEALILGLLAEKLVREEGCDLELVGGSALRLKAAPGPINRDYGVVRVTRNGDVMGELMTDVEFMGLGRELAGPSTPASLGDYHELDILMVPSGTAGRPIHREVLLGVECKNTFFQKHYLREALGLRRELSLLKEKQPTVFETWPRRLVPAEPSSCLLVYSSDYRVTDYAASGTPFGIDLEYHSTT